MKFGSWFRKTDPVKEFAATLIMNSEQLASQRAPLSPIASNKYQLLREFAQTLVFNSYSMTSVLQEDNEIDNKQFSFIFFEHLYLFISLVDRAAYQSFELEERLKLMRELTDFALTLSIVTLFPNLADGDKEVLYRQCVSNLNSTAEEYSRYKIIQSEGESGSADTIFWEFSKKIQEFTKDPYNVGGMVGLEFPLVQALRNIDMDSFLHKMK